jgi:hypothetical protein
MPRERFLALFEYFAAHIDKFNPGCSVSFKETPDALRDQIDLSFAGSILSDIE